MSIKSKRISRRLKWLIIGALLMAPLSLAAYIAWGFYGGQRVDVAVLKHRDHAIYQMAKRDDGSVNYAQAVLQIYADGVTEENNATLLFLKTSVKLNSVGDQDVSDVQPFQIVDIDELLADESISVGDLDRAAGWNLLKRAESNESLCAFEQSVLQSWLPKQTVALDRLELELRTRPRYAIPSNDADLVYSIILPHFEEMTAFAQWFLIRARIRVSEGRFPEAVQDIVTALELAERFSQGPFLVEQFCAGAIFTSAFSHLTPILRDQDLPKDQWTELSSLLQRIDLKRQLQKSIDIGERAMNTELYDLIATSQLEDFMKNTAVNRSVVWIPPGWVSSTASVDQKNDRLDWLIERFEDEDTVAAMDLVKQWGQEISSKELGDTDWTSFFPSPRQETHRRIEALFGLSGLANEKFNLLEFSYEKQVRRHILQLLIAIRLFEMKNHQLPETLPQLPNIDAAVMQDPFSGKSLIYRQTENGRFQLYSLGANWQDDDGDTELDIGCF